MGFSNSLKLQLELDTSHYDFENFVEFVGGEAFDVLGAASWLRRM